MTFRSVAVALFLPFLLAAFSSAAVFAETVELVTYYPSNPTTGDLHVRSITVGTDYEDETPANGEALIVGPVGIGTTAPQAMLDIYSQDETYVRISGTGINADPENFSGLELGGDLPAGGGIDRIWQLAHKRGGAGAVNDLHVNYFDGAAWGTTMAFQPDGDIGIGTAAPAGVLHLVGKDDVDDSLLLEPGQDTGDAGTPGMRLEVRSPAYTEKIRLVDTTANDSAGIYIGTGSPEGLVAAQLGSLFIDRSTGTVFRKAANDGLATGWGGLGGSGGGEVLIVADHKPAGTSAGTFTSNGWRTRDLNVEKTNTIPGASLASNRISLPAGTYRIDWSAPAYAVRNHQTRLFNVTSGTAIALGTYEWASIGYEGQTRSMGSALVTLAGPAQLELQHRCSTTQTSDGFGYAKIIADWDFGVSVEYSLVTVTKVS